MAETTDHPHVPGQVPPHAVMTAESLPPGPPASSEPYQPLSLLALAGFGIAIAYALVVLIGAAIALFTHVPWLMSYWTFLLPFAALIVCWAARTRIRNSEATLSGLAFTTWGFRLTILVGLTYAAYYGFAFFAVRLHAVNCADDFFEQLRQGKLDRAFILSQGVSPKGMDNSQLRDAIETRFNHTTGNPRMALPFTAFRQNQFIRFIEMGGLDSKITPLGVVTWEYGKGGYRVLLKYHIATPVVDFDMNVDTFGRDPRPDEPKGSQWHVRLQGGETATLQETIRLTPLGDEILNRRVPAGKNFVIDWVTKLNQLRWDQAYLDTLKPSERKSARAQQKPAELRANLEKSPVIRIPPTFWSGKAQRDAIEKRVAQTFKLDAAGKPTFNLVPHGQVAMPVVRDSGGRTTLLFDVIFHYYDEASGKTQYTVDAQVVVSANSSEAAESPSAWQIEGIDLDSGRVSKGPTPEDYQRNQRRGPSIPLPPP
jgi:hypothetical protein